MAGPAGGVAIAIPDFWQQFPKAVEIDGRAIRIELFPRQWADLHELQGGERKTHTVWLQFGSEEDCLAPDLDFLFRPAWMCPTPQWLASAGVLPQLGQGSKGLTNLDSLLSEAIEGEHGVFANRELVDEYGWRSYGDLLADHEQERYVGPGQLISHHNNQFDPLFGFVLHYLRTGSYRLFELADALARHVSDIDIYHTQEDRAAYNGGLFWFTDHFLHAATSTHRTFSRANAQLGHDYGGGPGTSHLFTTGLLYHYFLTGNPDSAAAVLELADWVIAMDDGRNTVLGLVDDGPTGLATATGDRNYHGPGRGAGNSVNALLDAWCLSRERRYLKYAEVVIRRVIHPADDVAARDLLNVEKRWSYTVFLTSLAKYLDIKAEASELDESYSFARASLLHYAAWMAEFEQPYFDQAEKLEFPTEAWAAQEFRKANVFRHAARYASAPLRARLLQRGEQFADRAWADLMRFETRTRIRALSIVMTEGLWDSYFRSTRPRPAPEPAISTADFGSPSMFVTQRQRVRQALKSPLGILGAVAAILNPWRWFRIRWRLK
jgi:hypothetical protein